MKSTLVIMAAGIGSRYGVGIKQLEPVGLADELIMDYSVHDAIEAGFSDIIFVIRKDIEKDFREIIGDRISAACAERGVTVSYAFQEKDRFVDSVPAGRTKPWGTGHAVLCYGGDAHFQFRIGRGHVVSSEPHGHTVDAGGLACGMEEFGISPDVQPVGPSVVAIPSQGDDFLL